MALYDNQNCPVCGRAFESGDDVVFCPECGTPHHRDCYNLSGHCVNAGLHKSGYNYFEEHKTEMQSEKAKTAPVSSAEKGENPFRAFLGDDSYDELYNPDNDSDMQIPVEQREPFAIPFSQFENDKEPIGGEKAIDVAATVRTNIPRFLLKFRDMEKSGKKLSWNWGAFLFGELYFFFRKMYKQALTLTSISLFISVLATFIIEKVAPKTAAIIHSIEDASAKADTEAITEKANEIITASDYGKYRLIVFGMLGAILLIRIIAAAFADYSYKNTVILMIKKVREQLDSGASFNQRTSLPFDNAPELSQDQMKWIYLSRRGGTSIFAPFAAILVIELIVRFL